MSSNPITGDALRTKLGDKQQQEKYAENYDKIFGKKKKPEKDDPYWKKYFEDKDNANKSI
jgi:hypothetical protein